MADNKVVTDKEEEYLAALYAAGGFPDPYVDEAVPVAANTRLRRADHENRQKQAVFGDKSIEKESTFHTTEERVMSNEQVTQAAPVSAPVPAPAAPVGVLTFEGFLTAQSQTMQNVQRDINTLATAIERIEKKNEGTWQGLAMSAGYDIATTAAGVGVAFGVYMLVGKLFGGDAPLPPPVL